MANKISTVIDFATDTAKSALSSFRTSVDEADGAGGKFKAGFSSVKDTVTENAGAIAAIGGAALVTFGVKAVGAFTDTAKAALDLSTSTGLSTEQASRWIAVGDDFQVSAEALATGLGKVSKTLDSGKWEKYGIATHDAAGNARSANDILLDSFDKLSAITNETERARVGQELFGKGYQSLTPILGHTRAEYEKMLGTVEQGQVITDQEAAKAEKFRLAEDQLGDALKDVTIAVGEQVAGLAPLLVGLAKLIGMLSTGVGDFVNFEGGSRATLDALHDMRGEVEKAGLNYDDLQTKVLSGRLTLEQLNTTVNEAAAAHKSVNDTLDGGERSWEMTAAAANELDEKFKGVVQSEYDVAAASSEARRNIDDLKGAVDAATGTVGDYELSNLKLVDAVADLATKTTEANAALADSTKTDVEKAAAVRDVREGQIELAKQMLDNAGQYATEQGAVDGTTRFYGLQRDKLIEMKAQYPELRDLIQQYIDKLNNIPGVVDTNVRVFGPNGAPVLTPIKGQFASGGPTMAGGVYEVAEGGRPELYTQDGKTYLIPGGDGQVKPFGGAGGGGAPIVVNVYVAGSVMAERDLARSVADGIVDGQRRGEITAGFLVSP